MIHNDVAIIMYYWNHFKRDSLLKNFFICHNNLSKYNVNIIPIEISTNGSFDLNFPGTIKFQTDQLLWQKERVINFAVQKLPENIKYVGFIDGDILFANDNWVLQAKEKLESINDLMLQLFSVVYYLPKNHSKYNGYYSYFNYSIGKNIIDSNGIENYKANFFSDSFYYANPGMAWICKKETLLKYPLYDKCIIGGGDTINLINWLGIKNSDNIPFVKKNKKKNQIFVDELKMMQNIVLNISCLDSPIFHLNHGNKIDRQYKNRLDILEKYNFNPITDLTIEQGLYRYTGNNSGILDGIKEYFKQRNEDIE